MRHQLFNIDTALITQRCVVRRFRENDGKALYRLLDNNRDYLLDHFPYLMAEAGRSKKGSEIFVRECIAEWLLQKRYAMGVWHHETTELVGFVQVFNLDWGVPMGELGYFIDRELIRQGIMTEVLAQVVRFAFLQLELDKLVIKTLIDNYASQRLARRVGFSREGELRNEYRLPGGTLVDLMRFGFARETYGE
ncbi:RimJ/RimL family protein N-acetyltransferase [Lewinella marina]|uniref:GNAT family N-acetyltransferase n=1 Tax=Neolewinella marina TaxID=438751 RepID=A0A2G0CEV3_9BACT|nr:GNAT family protein [Neolewinella marina]NJB85825.1 RimJ/RimL family protein N-acetyltransferase [Neolewinella marina]PHK98506.1 GNAT family N-acetyltransferase [Neolewinella marina]